jgi:hypothetical protein
MNRRRELTDMAQTSGLRYIQTTANCSSNTSSLSVPCDYSSFIFVAEAQNPNLASNNYASYICFVIINGGRMAYIDTGGSFYTIRTQSGPKLQGTALSISYSKTNGVISVSTYSSAYMSRGTWDVIVVELPNDHPLHYLTVHTDS